MPRSGNYMNTQNMQDNSLSPDTSPDESDSGSEVKIYANLSTLEVQGQPPSVGDSVDLTVKGTVDSLDGDVACVIPTEVNGQPAPDAPDSEPDSDPDDMSNTRDKLMKQAQQSDSSGSY